MFRTATALALAGLTAACGLPDPQTPTGPAIDRSEAPLSLNANVGLQAVLAKPADDKSMVTPVSSFAYSGASIGYIESKLAQHGARLTNLERDPNEPSLFTATMVANAGAYQIAHWWHAVDVTEAALAAKLTNDEARLIDVQKYSTPQGDRFTAVMVKNTGQHAKDWWWYHDVTAATLAAEQALHGARITSLKSRLVNGATRYTAILIKNSGVDYKQSWFYPDVTPAAAEQLLAQHGARPIDIERRPNGKMDVVMVKNDGVGWWWWTSLSSIYDVTDLMAQKAIRPIEVERFYVNGQRRYAVLLVDNANADTRRVETAFSGLLTGGVYGARVKRVDGPVSVSLQDQYVFDPASALKVAHHTYALGTEFAIRNLPAAFSYPVDPNNPNLKSPCPDEAWLNGTNLVQTSILNGLTLMMQNSDNRVTRAFEDRYTRAALNQMMLDIGMTKSSLHQFIGCGYDNGQRNRTTARDLAHLYEQVRKGAVLPDDARQVFFATLVQGVPARVQQMINEEGAKLGKDASFLFEFRNATRMRWKGGSYDVCNAPNCQSYEYVRSTAGILTVPVKPEGNLGGINYGGAGSAERHIAYSRFITGLTIPCTPQGANESLVVAEARCTELKAANDAMNAAEVEMFRGEIRAAMLTWGAPPAPKANPGSPNFAVLKAQLASRSLEPDEIDYDGGGEDSTRGDASGRVPPPGVEPDEIDYQGDAREPVPGVEPDEIDYQGDAAGRTPTPGVEPDEIDYAGREPVAGVEPDEIDVR